MHEIAVIRLDPRAELVQRCGTTLIVADQHLAFAILLAFERRRMAGEVRSPISLEADPQRDAELRAAVARHLPSVEVGEAQGDPGKDHSPGALVSAEELAMLLGPADRAWREGATDA